MISHRVTHPPFFPQSPPPSHFPPITPPPPISPQSPPPLPKSLSIELSTPLTEPLDLTTGYIAPVLFQILVPKLRAKPVRTASGIAVVAVMCKPHRNSDVVHYIAKNHSFVYSCSEAVFASAPAPGVKSGISKFLLNAFQAE